MAYNKVPVALLDLVSVLILEPVLAIVMLNLHRNCFDDKEINLMLNYSVAYRC